VTAVVAERSESIVLRGLSPQRMHARAAEEFDARFGGRSWRLREERFTPCLVTVGGRVRLYEGRFDATVS
jgi:hypothetical protein